MFLKILFSIFQVSSSVNSVKVVGEGTGLVIIKVC